MKTRFLLCLTFGLYLGICRGYLAIWNMGNPEPASVLPCRVDMLPEQDQKMLKEGIPISSSDELTKLLQDYLS